MTSDKLATPADAAAAYKTTVAYIYKMASLKRWRKVKHEGRIYYHWDDIGRDLGK